MELQAQVEIGKRERDGNLKAAVDRQQKADKIEASLKLELQLIRNQHDDAVSELQNQMNDQFETLKSKA